MYNDLHLMHGKHWTGQDLAGWWISEKYDGCRGIWDGRSMWSRNGNRIDVPPSWADALPDMPLDGEIWAGRGRFLESRIAVQYGRFTPDIAFMVFDAPAAGEFEARLELIRSALSRCRVARPVSHARCASTRSALALARKIQTSDGEGVIARAPRLHYVPGRTADILKLKHF